MKAIGYKKALPITDPESLTEFELEKPKATGGDLLVNIRAVAVNPVDCKVRQNSPSNGSEYKILGWDAVGDVVEIGEKVTRFKKGDVVYYAGDITRQGSNAEYQLIDERIVGHKPKSLSDTDAAALPLTSITAWELLFEHLQIQKQLPTSDNKSDEVLLVVGAAGGVGSILLQLAKAISGATIIATASRESSATWVKKLGADHVVDHTKPLKSQIEALGIGQVTHVASLNSTESYFETYIELLPAFGKIAMIDDPKSLDTSKLKSKSLSLHLEFMFARSMHNATDMIEQSHLLNRVAELVDQGYVSTTVGKNLGALSADNLKAAHAELESGKSIGKIVLQGFE